MKKLWIIIGLIINILFTVYVAVIAVPMIEAAYSVWSSDTQSQNFNLSFTGSSIIVASSLVVLLLFHAASDLFDSVKLLKQSVKYGIPKFNVKTPMPEVKAPKQPLEDEQV